MNIHIGLYYEHIVCGFVGEGAKQKSNQKLYLSKHKGIFIRICVYILQFMYISDLYNNINGKI